MTLLFQDTLAQEVKMIARFQEFLEMPINFSVESINYFHPKTLWIHANILTSVFPPILSYNIIIFTQS